MKKLLLMLSTMSALLTACSQENLLQTQLDQQEGSPVEASLFSQEATELKEKRGLQVSGKIPAWLEGTFVRNGPGKFKVGQQQLTHWFDGFAFLTVLSDF